MGACIAKESATTEKRNTEQAAKLAGVCGASDVQRGEG
jgi:hypothetical protein